MQKSPINDQRYKLIAGNRLLRLYGTLPGAGTVWFAREFRGKGFNRDSRLTHFILGYVEPSFHITGSHVEEIVSGDTDLT